MNEGSHSGTHEGSYSTGPGALGVEPEQWHQMDGIPTWLAITGVVLIIVTSHLLVARRNVIPSYGSRRRFDILGISFLKRLVKKSYFPILAQSFSLIIFSGIIIAGLIGSPRSNIAPVLTWTWWWVLLIFFVLGFGTLFCAICPWEAISTLVTSLSLSSRRKKIGFEKTFPKFARNTYPAILLFVFLTWFELGFDVTRSPVKTAVMGLIFTAAAITCALIYEKRAFCRYVCLVGRIQGLYALFSPVELRPVNHDVCRSCSGKECHKGDATHTGCPTNLFPGNLFENTYCTMCTECVRSCPHDNIGINLRPPAADLIQKTRFKWDEAILAIVLLALTSFHGMTMTPWWNRINDLIRADTGLGPVPVFSGLMALMLILPVVLFAAAANVSCKLVPGAGIPPGKIFRAFAYAVIPVALFYHLAHNGMHFFMEAQHILPLLSDPFGWGWDVFGTAHRRYAPLLSLPTIWYLQIMLIVVGHIYGVIVADRIARRLFDGRTQVIRGLAPLIVTMILYSGFSVWLIAQPMTMRSGM